MTKVMSEQAEKLSELVTRKRDEGWTLREMERRAEARGQKISHSQLADYAARTVSRMPTREMVEALAAALDVGVDEVRAAAMMEFWGYVPRELKMRGRGSRIGAAVPPDLSPEDEEELLRMVQAWISARRG